MIDEIKYNSEGLIPVIIQEYKTNEVLMLAWMNQESLEKTIKTKQTVFWSRSRNTLWKKGETSGNIQIVKEIKIDCDRVALIIKVDAKGPACHTGEESSFFKNI